MTRVLVGVAAYKTINSRTVESLLWLAKYSIYDVMFSIQDCCYVVENRSRIIKDAISHKADYLLFIDSDMRFYPEILEQLMKHDKDIVGAAYNYRKFPIESTAKFEGEMPNELFKVDALGTGMMLIKMSALEKIPRPWIKMEYNDDGSVKVGDDVYFCLQAKKAGIEIWCDPTLDVKHIGDYFY